MVKKLPVFFKTKKNPKSYAILGGLGRGAKLKKDEQKGGFWQWLKDSSDQLKLIAALLAGLYAAFEYKVKDHADRVKTSTEVVDKFMNSDDHKSLIELEDLWLNEHSASRISLNNSTMTSVQFRQRVDLKVRAEKRPQMLKVLRGLKSVAVCGIQGRCDTNTLCFYLADRIQDLRCNFRETLAILSADNGSCVTDELNYLLDNYCSDWMSINSGINKYRGIEDNICLFDKDNKQNLLGQSCSVSIVNRKAETFISSVFR